MPGSVGDCPLKNDMRVIYIYNDILFIKLYADGERSERFETGRRNEITEDLVDRLIEDWRREMPSLNTGGIAIIGRILRLGSLLESRMNAKLKPFGLIYTDFDLLATLRRSGRDYCLTPTELRQSVLLTSGAMTAALDRLQKMGLITRVRNKSDRRSMSAKLTPAGAALLEKVLVVRFDDANDAASALTQSQTEAMVLALRRMLLSLEKQAKPNGTA